MHVLQILLLAHKLMYHKHRLPCIFRNYFKLNMNVDKHNTRGSNDLHVTAVNKNYGKRSIKHKCSIIWNKLPSNFKHYSSIKNFTKKLKVFLQSCNTFYKFVIYTVFQKKFTLLLFAMTKSDVDRFQ